MLLIVIVIVIVLLPPMLETTVQIQLGAGRVKPEGLHQLHRPLRVSLLHLLHVTFLRSAHLHGINELMKKVEKVPLLTAMPLHNESPRSRSSRTGGVTLVP